MYCTNCNKYTNNPKFCNRSCAAIFNNTKHPKRILKEKNLKCKECGNTFPKTNYKDRRKYCPLCKKNRNYYSNITVGEYRNKKSLKHAHGSWTNIYIRNFARSWNSDLKKLPCANCGYDKHVEICHIKAISTFASDALLSEVNDRNNLIQLCPNCHWEFDNNLLTIEQINKKSMPIL